MGDVMLQMSLCMYFHITCCPSPIVESAVGFSLVGWNISVLPGRKLEVLTKEYRGCLGWQIYSVKWMHTYCTCLPGGGFAPRSPTGLRSGDWVVVQWEVPYSTPCAGCSQQQVQLLPGTTIKSLSANYATCFWGYCIRHPKARECQIIWPPFSLSPLISMHLIGPLIKMWSLLPRQASVWDPYRSNNLLSYPCERIATQFRENQTTHYVGAPGITTQLSSGKRAIKAREDPLHLFVWNVWNCQPSIKILPGWFPSLTNTIKKTKQQRKGGQTSIKTIPLRMRESFFNGLCLVLKGDPEWPSHRQDVTRPQKNPVITHWHRHPGPLKAPIGIHSFVRSRHW